jgi:hypothetical protein
MHKFFSNTFLSLFLPPGSTYPVSRKALPDKWWCKSLVDRITPRQLLVMVISTLGKQLLCFERLLNQAVASLTDTLF